MKILEIKGDMWSKGLSVQDGLALGGLFTVLSGTDIYERVGYLQPSLAATELTAPATNPIKIITNWNDGGTAKVLAHSTTKLYSYLRGSPYTQTDITASTAINTSATPVGGIFHKGRYVYAQATDLRSINLAGDEDQLLNGSNSSSLDIRKLCVGADKNLYIGDYGSIAKAVIVTGTSGNAADAFLIDENHTTRDLVNEGRFLVTFADSNSVATTTRQPGNYSCRAYFWEMAKAAADVIWDFPGESYIIGAAKLGSEIIVFGYSGIWVCNAATEPYQIASFLGNSTLSGKRPANPYQISASPTSVFWGVAGSSGQQIYAYGSLPGSAEKRFYTPYTTHTSSAGHTAISYSAGTLFAATDAPKFYAHNVGTTKGNTTATTAPTLLSQPYRYSHAIVSLREKLTTGQSVAFSAKTASDVVISDTDTKNYVAANPLKRLKFDLKPTTNSVSIMDDISFTVTGAAGATVERVAIYGEPNDDSTQG